MRRLLRFAFKALILLSLLACVASAELSWRSRSITDSLWIRPRSDTPPFVHISSDDGMVVAEIGDFFLTPPDGLYESISTIVRFGPERRWFWTQVPKVRRGTGIGARPQSHVFQFYTVEIFPPSGSIGTIGVKARGWQVVAAPNWLLMLLAASIPMMCVARKTAVALRSRRRSRRGLCVACGYDIRAGHDCCPECGKPLKPPDAAAIKVRKRHWAVLTMAVVLLSACLWPVALELAARKRSAHYQKLADSLEWRWTNEKASLAYSIAHAPSDCKIELTRSNPDSDLFARIRMTRADKELFGWTSDTATVFVRKGMTLVYAEHPLTRGCHLVAVDLEDGRVLWETFINPDMDYLLGVSIGDPTEHRAILELLDDAGEVWVNEPGALRYVAFVDLRSGRLLGRHVFSKKW